MNIDRVAREVVNVEPSADLEARIRARVRNTPPARPIVWSWWRVAVPAAAIATVALIVIPFMKGRELVTTPLPGAVTQQASSAPVVPPPSAPPSTSSTRAIQRATLPSLQAKASPAQLSAEELAWMERRMPALDPVNALEVDRLRVDSIQPEPLAITPLTMTPVATEGTGTGRNDR